MVASPGTGDFIIDQIANTGLLISASSFEQNMALAREMNMVIQHLDFGCLCLSPVELTL
jgi:hypothetical protein